MTDLLTDEHEKVNRAIGFLRARGIATVVEAKKMSNRMDKRIGKTAPEPVKQDPRIAEVYDKWNSYKGRVKAGTAKLASPVRFHSHPNTSPEIDVAVRGVLKRYELDTVLKAIDSYALVLLGFDYAWTYAWNLREFLTRSRPDRRDELQFWRWLPNNFEHTDYYKPGMAKRKAEAKRAEARKPIKPDEPTEKIDMAELLSGDTPFERMMRAKKGIKL